jgi:hypothetical protein
MEFDQAHYKDLLKMILRKFISYFFSFISFTMNFRRLYEFLELFNLEKKFRRGETVTGQNWPKASRAWPGPAAKSAQGARGGAVARSLSAR